MRQINFLKNVMNSEKGLTIPEFVLNDSNLDWITGFSLSKLLKILSLNEYGEISVTELDSFHVGQIDIDVKSFLYQFQQDNYIELDPECNTNDNKNLMVKIHPHYLKYLDRKPFYSDYEDSYQSFLIKEVFPVDSS